jgi:riboflavin kinase/FMN adenylyltransferase
MQVVWGRKRLATDLHPRPSAPAVAIGNFDGVHRGHQALVAEARAQAHARRSTAGVLTFDPHPSQFFATRAQPERKGQGESKGKDDGTAMPAATFPLLVPLPRRLELLGEAGADFICVEPFDAALAAMTPEEFVAEVLVRGLGVGSVVVGYDFCFGRKRAGNAATLTALGQQQGFAVTVVPPIEAGGVVVSSSKVRELLAQGQITRAAELLGRPPEITGEVVRGAGRGRGFGVPTANLRPEAPLTFATGIYAARAQLLGPDRHATYAAAVSVGTNPTFVAQGDTAPDTAPGTAPVTIEAYLLDYPDEDLYGARVRLLFVEHLRPERRFDSVAALKAAIDDDIARTRVLVK